MDIQGEPRYNMVYIERYSDVYIQSILWKYDLEISWDSLSLFTRPHCVAGVGPKLLNYAGSILLWGSILKGLFDKLVKGYPFYSNGSTSAILCFGPGGRGEAR